VRITCLTITLFLCLARTAAFATEDPDYSEAGHGHFFVSYQFIHVDGFEATTGELPIGTTDTHTLNFELDYQLNDRWGFDIGIPLVRKRYQGPGAHNPALIIPPQDSKFIDDGEYHTDFQDWHLAVRYRLRDDDWRIEPFAALGVPSNDYPFFAHAAVGQNLLKFDVGSRFIYTPPISDAWYRLDVSYVFVEETLGTNIDHWRVNGEAGYFFSPRLSARVFFLLKEGNGLDFPDDFPPPRNDFYWYQHDRMVKHNYINAGLGLDWTLNDRYQLSFSWMTMVHADQVHIMKYAFTLGIARSF